MEDPERKTGRLPLGRREMRSLKSCLPRSTDIIAGVLEMRYATRPRKEGNFKIAMRPSVAGSKLGDTRRAVVALMFPCLRLDSSNIPLAFRLREVGSSEV